MFQLIDILKALYDAFDTADHPIWEEYWASEQGQKLLKDHSVGDGK
jgi:hypothetical protein